MLSFEELQFCAILEKIFSCQAVQQNMVPYAGMLMLCFFLNLETKVL